MSSRPLIHAMRLQAPKLSGLVSTMLNSEGQSSGEQARKILDEVILKLDSQPDAFTAYKK